MDAPTHYPLLVFAISFVALWLSARAGWWFRSRQGTLDAELRETSASSWLLRSRCWG